MEWKSFFVIYATIFMMELGDKTQLSTFLFSASGKSSPWLVFAGSALALVSASAIGVMAGSLISQHVNLKYLHFIAGALFIGIGVWTIVKA